MKKGVAVLFALASSAAVAADPVLLNTSFESTSVGGGYAYGNVAGGWAFTGGAGVSANGTAWNGITTSGTHFAFLQNVSSVSQTFTSSSAFDYSFSFDTALRPGYRLGQTVQVALDGHLLGTVASLTPTWTTTTFSAANIGGGTHTLSFSGMADGATYVDTSAFLDNVRMTVTPVPEPETYAMMLAGLGLLGFMARRKKSA